MSDNQGATSASTLEEALAEIAGLREQLSGSDLKAFTQNRDLRQENGKLRDEVTRLTEECVTQTFNVRSLEKAKANLEKQVAALENQVSALESAKSALEAQKADLEARNAQLQNHVAELEGRTQDLTEQLGVHRSQEIHLSQELERTISTNAEEISRLRAEHSQELENTRQTLEQARAEIEQQLNERLAAKAAEVEGLERRVEQFKEEFLSQEVAPIAAPPQAEEGRAFLLLRSKMEELLGFPGKTLVEQVFRHCGADETTSDPTVLEETFEALQDTASKLVRNPEQEQELANLLKSAWQDLGLGDRSSGRSASSEPVAEAQAEPVAEAQPGTVAEAQAEPVAEAQPEPVAEAQPEPVAEAQPEPVAEAQPEPVAEAQPETVAEAQPEPAAEAQPEPVAEAQPEPVDEAQPEPVAEAQPEPVDEAQPEPVAEAQPEPVDEAQLEPVAEAQPEPVDEAQLEPVAEAQPEPVAEAQPEPVAEAQPEPVAEAQPEPVAEAQPEPVAEAQPEPVAEAQPEPVAEAQPEPVAEAQPEPAAEAQPEPAAVLPGSEEVTEEEMPPVAAAEPVQPKPVFDSIDAALAEPSTETSQESPQAVPEPASEAPSESAAEEEASDSEDADFEAAAAALQNGDFAAAWPVFHKLRSAEPTEPTYLVGEIAALAGLERFQEAYALGKGLDPEALEDSADVYRESFESVLVGLAEQADSLLARKGYLIELIDLVDDPERVASYLDAAEEIALRTSREGELSLLQARYRIAQDDVTEYLIEALSSVADKPEIFDLMRQNLERYPELAPLSEFMERLLDSSRDAALEAESGAKELISPEEALEDLLEEGDPGEEALVQVFLEHLLPRTGVKVDLPSEAFEDLLQESEPAAFVGALRQALRSVDYTLFFDEIEVLSYDGDEHFLLRSSPEPKATLLFGSNVDDVPPEELRFLVLRELFSMFRRHSHLAHLAAQLHDQLRYTFVKTCLEIHKEAEFQIPDALLAEVAELESLATEGGQDAHFRARLESILYAIYQATESDSFVELHDFLYDGQLHKKWLDPLADGFAAKQTGLVVASFAIARDVLDEEDFEALEEAGFQWLYQPENLERLRDLRLRLQRLWAMPFKALVSDAEGDEE